LVMLGPYPSLQGRGKGWVSVRLVEEDPAADGAHA